MKFYFKSGITLLTDLLFIKAENDNSNNKQ